MDYSGYYFAEDVGMVGRRIGFISFEFYDKNTKSWIPDDSCIFSDRLMGYDSSEPKDSPYKIGDTSELEKIREITEEEAIKLISEM